MAALLPVSNQLDRLGRELKCSICLSLFKQASSLSCNHTFCRSCILQSVKSKPTCPLCKVPTTRREIRQAPQMDSLVAIYVSMGNAAGIDFMASQAAIDTAIEPDRAEAEHSNKKRKALSNITNNEKRMKSEIYEQKSPEHSFKGRVLPKKRVQVPKPSSLKGEFGFNKDESNFAHKTCSVETSEFPDYMRLKGINDREEELTDLDAVTICTQMPKCKKKPKARKGKKVYSNKKTTKESEERKDIEVNTDCETKKELDDLEEEFSKPHCTDINIKKSGCSPKEEGTGRIKLDPFFWLRTDSSQNSEEIHPTQTTASHSGAQLAFSDLKDCNDDINSDEEIALVRPAFSDLKDSDDDIDADEEITKSHAIVNDSDVDDYNLNCTQEATEALKSNPSTVTDSDKGPMPDLSLESNEHFVRKVRLSPDNVELGFGNSQERVLSPCEKMEKVLHLDSKKEDLALRGCKTLMNIYTSQKEEDMALGSLTDPTKLYHSETFLTDEVMKGDSISNCKRKRRISEGLEKKRKCALAEKAVSIVKMDALASDGRKKSEECYLNEGASSIQASFQTVQTKPDKLEVVKSTTQNSMLNMQKSDTYRPECVFCGSSKDSKVTGPMKHYNQNGIPIKEVKSEAKIVHVHTYCAEWAPDVYFVDDVAKNLTAESVRGQKMKCSCCGKKGAALGCCLKRCKKSYHYPCAKSLACKWNEDKFIMLCPEHASEKFPGNDQKEVSDHDINTKHKTDAIKKINASSSAEKTRMDNRLLVQKWQYGVAHKWVLCGSALDSTGKEQLASFAKLTGASITKTWTSNVTHVIAGSDEHGAARRTLKFLLAMLEGKWILRLDWLKACTQAMKPVNEEHYEIPRDIHGVSGGPRKARLLASHKGSKLFEEFQFHFMGDFLPDYRGDLQALVMAGGGVVLHRRPVTSVKDAEQKQTIIVYNNEPTIGITKDELSKLLSKRQTEAKELGVLVKNSHVVPHHWILDSIASSELHAFPLK